MKTIVMVVLALVVFGLCLACEAKVAPPEPAPVVEPVVEPIPEPVVVEDPEVAGLEDSIAEIDVEGELDFTEFEDLDAGLEEIENLDIG